MPTNELYVNDSYVTTCEAHIIKIEGEKVILDQTVFYPTGGGQEHDTGVLIQENEVFDVHQVKREKGEVIHYIKNAQQLKIGKVTARIDWERRMGLMRHHSLLHVLGAVVYKKYGALCTGNKIYPTRARIDFDHLQDVTDEQAEEIVRETNKILEEHYPITLRYVSREEAENISGVIKTSINLLPPSIKTVRLVSISSIDEQACGGTHVSNTKEIGKMVLDKITSKGKNNKRFEVSLVRY
ncbi:alanyl-tRNA editing protein [Aneurinibacillus migulanus]|uniref:Alanyl tRNA synthetase n=1 Tax=Aneurinibacillus migulanus TaxID=47500 RepID=A0A0D1WJD3_ANEMI|nr:alanyl-tRNA editing protein [Aneurinibacillus migulanus]KIV58680.1 alanyl tRNA synthetase [Aneurinibacillus migulanus]KON96369.1 alanyl tRNA synthetase [Aneurinibacillus migulanus]MED0892298.1 alanyl-tRNA editing protein [Aneurinibacillus migulanus]MED1615750.1 alanyl-tRNA editing protein [Aneurinibacillus migulanus]SDI23057.1 misacylated tRNA(Ala) deacylase [Aneurinibacillus migulanus]